MLAALLQNNNNSARIEARPPMVKIDRGGGGPLWPRVDIVDIASAVAAFPEIAGEDSVVRAVRRTRWIGQALPLIKEAREKREAAAFLAGISIGASDPDRAAPAPPSPTPVADLDASKIEQLVAIIDAVRADANLRRPPLRHEEGARRAASTAMGGGLFIGGLIIGGIFVALMHRRRR